MLGKGFYSNQAAPSNPEKDFEVTEPPDDSVSVLAFSPAALQKTFLIAGSWDSSIRCWEVEDNGNTVPNSIQSTTRPILDACWSDDGTKVFMASCNKQVKLWDLGSNKTMQLEAHDAPVKTCNWIKAPSYACLMTGSWDKTLKFWDTRSPNPMTIINFTERIYCADVGYPMAVIGTASNSITVYNLERKPKFVKNVIPPLKGQLQCLAIFRDKRNQYPNGFALGSVEGRVAIHYLQPKNTKENFTFKCHPYSNIGNENIHDAHGVNDIKIHPVHGTLATVGSDATYAFWDKDSRTKLKSSEKFAQSITKCCFDSKGEIFAYSVGYDWSKGHEYYNPDIKSQIFLKPCFEDLKPK